MKAVRDDEHFWCLYTREKLIKKISTPYTHINWGFVTKIEKTVSLENFILVSKKELKKELVNYGQLADLHGKYAKQKAYKIAEGYFQQKLIDALINKEFNFYGCFPMEDNRVFQLVLSTFDKDTQEVFLVVKSFVTP
jgi:hypothetical protein